MRHESANILGDNKHDNTCTKKLRRLGLALFIAALLVAAIAYPFLNTMDEHTINDYNAVATAFSQRTYTRPEGIPNRTLSAGRSADGYKKMYALYKTSNTVTTLLLQDAP